VQCHPGGWDTLSFRVLLHSNQVMSSCELLCFEKTPESDQLSREGRSQGVWSVSEP
jgi:hypothetical protein